MTDYFNVLAKYATFSGRARRREYFTFLLVNCVVSVILGVIAAATDSSVSALSTLYSLVMVIPGIAVAVRRMHDTGHSGWYILIPIYSLVLLFTAGDQDENQFGSDPKAIPQFA